MKIVTEKLQIN